jgi:hypothetical protein
MDLLYFLEQQKKLHEELLLVSKDRYSLEDALVAVNLFMSDKEILNFKKKDLSKLQKLNL